MEVDDQVQPCLDTKTDKITIASDKEAKLLEH